MKVKELIEHLKSVDQDLEVSIFWDGSPRGDVDGLYINSGKELVIVGEWSIYEDEIRRSHKVIYKVKYL